MLNCSASLDQMFHALADGNRREMIDRLSQGDLSVSELQKPLGISLPATLQHLAVLENAGLIRTFKTGRVRTCSLDTGALSQAETWINERRRFWETRLDRLGEFLSATQQADQGKGSEEE